MALPTAYLTSIKNLKGILTAIQTAQAPEKFSQAFLGSLDFKSSTDRLFINVFKSLGFIDDSGKPTQRYYEYLDQTQSNRILADGIREAYADIFKINKDAHKLSRTEVINKLKTLSQGQYSDGVLTSMASTFTNLVKYADFSASKPLEQKTGEGEEEKDGEPIQDHPQHHEGMKVKGLVYNINIVLPETRDNAVYDAIFQSLRKHLK